MLEEFQVQAIARQKAISVSPERNVIETLPEAVQEDLRRRAHHALPRVARLQLTLGEQALYESEIALELAQVYIDLQKTAVE
jgi:hypothetical protein